MGHYDWLTRLIPWVEARLSRYANLTIANSHAGAEWAISRGFSARRMRVVPNGIDTARFQPDPVARAPCVTAGGFMKATASLA